MGRRLAPPHSPASPSRLMLYRLEAGRFASRLKARLPDEQRPSTPRGSPGGKAPAHPPTPDDAEESTSLTDRLDGSRDVLEVVA